MPYRVCLDYEPIIVVEFRGTLLDTDFVAMKAEVTLQMRHHASLNIRTAVVLDFSEATPITPSQRQSLGQWRVEVRDLTAQVAVGMAMVVRSSLIRGIVTAISWFQKEPVPVVFVETFDEAVAWALTRLAASQIDVPSHVRLRLQARSTGKRRAL